VDGKTPHAARHAMDRHLIAKTGNVAAVQRQRKRRPRPIGVAALKARPAS
jgi:hypothetical protein